MSKKRTHLLSIRVIVVVAYLTLPSVSRAEGTVGPFQLAAESAYRGLQALVMKRDGISEERVRAQLIGRQENADRSDLMSVIIANILPNFIDKIYVSTGVEYRSVTHKLIEDFLSFTRKKYGKPKTYVEIQYEKCLETHRVTYHFSLSLKNQLQSTLNDNYSSVRLRAHENYLVMYANSVKRSSQKNSDLIFENFSSCFKAVAGK